MDIIKTEKFKIRLYKKSDKRSLIEHINDEEVATNLLVVPHPYTGKDADEWWSMQLSERRKKPRKGYSFSIDVGGKVVGGIGIKNIEGHRAEIGYWIGRKYWGQGIMTEAVTLFTEHCFKEYDLKRLYATVFPPNKASARVLEKVGYTLEGRLHKYHKKGEEFIDCLLYAKVK